MKKIILSILFLISMITFSETSAEDLIGIFNKNVSKKYGKLVDKYSKQLGIPNEVIVTVMARETQGRNLGPSLGLLNKEKKANKDLQPMGVMQLSRDGFIEGLMETGMSRKEATRLSTTEYRMNPELSIRAGSGYIKKQLKRCKGNMGCAIGSYNSGYGGFKDFINGNGSSERRKEASHYLVDVNEKMKVIEKVKKNGINSLTNYEKQLMKNGINTTGKRNKWKEALNDLSGGKYDINSLAGADDEFGTSNSSTINYGTTVNYDWDGIATTISNYIEQGVKLLGNISIFVISILFSIQVIMDLWKVYATFDFIEFSKMFIKKLLTFSIYLFAIKKIIDGTLFGIVEEMAYELLKRLTGVPGVQKLSNIWVVKEKIVLNFWSAISELWGYSSFRPSEFSQDLITTVFLIIVIIFLNIAFFMMMLNLFKALISFKLVLGLSTILLPLGILDATKEYYNIGKVLSLILNFVIKLISINFIAIVIMNTLTNNNSILNFSVNDVTSILSQNFMVFLILIGVMWNLITKVDINF